MQSLRLIGWSLASLAALSLLGCAERTDELGESRIPEPHDYPWCEWSGEVKNGKPDGWGVGDCIVYRVRRGKEHLLPSVSRLLDEKPLSDPTSQAHEVPCRENSLRCECEQEEFAARWGMIDNYTLFRGYYADGRREGRGTYFFPNAEVYVGEWSNDTQHGYGTLFGPSCEVIYTGSWCEGGRGECAAT